MRRLFVLFLLADVLLAQTPAPETRDPLGRTTPQESILHFLEACHARDYGKAVHYLDLRKMPPEQVVKDGPDLARQLEDLLDDTPFDIATLSRDPDGDQSDELSAAFDRLDTFHIDGQTLELKLERVELKPGFRVWLVSSDSVPLISRAH
jgi:MscS family membrane protein